MGDGEAAGIASRDAHLRSDRLSDADDNCETAGEADRTGDASGTGDDATDAWRLRNEFTFTKQVGVLRAMDGEDGVALSVVGQCHATPGPGEPSGDLSLRTAKREDNGHRVTGAAAATGTAATGREPTLWRGSEGLRCSKTIG